MSYEFDTAGLDQLIEAFRVMQTKGIKGYSEVSGMVGQAAANALLVALMIKSAKDSGVPRDQTAPYITYSLQRERLIE